MLAQWEELALRASREQANNTKCTRAKEDAREGEESINSNLAVKLVDGTAETRKLWKLLRTHSAEVLKVH